MTIFGEITTGQRKAESWLHDLLTMSTHLTRAICGYPYPLPPPSPPPHYQLDGATGDVRWSYEATAKGVSEGRAFAIDLVGDNTIVVAGFTGGSAASQRGKAYQ